MTESDSSSQHSRHARVNDMDMYYEVYGRGKPLLLLHGGLGFAGEWEPFIPAFSERFQVFTLDSRGHARSDNPGTGLSYRVMSDDVAAFVELLELRRVSIVGNSDGAQVALELGVRYPELVDSLVICAGGTRSSATYHKAWQQLGIDPSGNVDFDQFQMAVGESTLDVLRKRHASSNDPDGWKDLTRHLAKMWMTPLEYGIEDFARIRGPGVNDAW